MIILHMRQAMKGGLIVLWLLLAVAACTSNAPPATQSPALPSTQAAAVELTPIGQAPTTDLPATVASEGPPNQSAIQPVISNEFIPSDPAQVSLAAGRPQLIEFFAFW